VVHYAGKPARVDAIRSVFDLPVIEDAAHAADSALGGRHCGTLGAVGIFSFDSVKNLATPEGGGLTCGSPELLARTKRLRYCGVGKSGFDAAGSSAAVPSRWWEYDVREIFQKSLPNDVAASIGLAQLKKLAMHQGRRRQIWRHYQEQFSEVAWLATPQDPAPDERHSYFTYLVRVLDGRRDKLAHRLREQGIYTTLRYHPLHLNGVYQWPSEQHLPNCELLSEQGLNLPLHPSLTDADVEQVVEGVKRL
jgi:dTDP-4-amino-4,6-dideoxygalactose transaminase